MQHNRKSRVYLALTVAVSLMLAGCGQEDERPREINWADEEILTQLGELKEQVTSLKEEMAGLNAKLDKVVTAKPTVPSAPASLPLPAEPFMGDQDADLGIIEYTDFQCPFCARHFRDVLPEIKREYVDKGKVRYWVQDFPLSFHKQALSAAVAVRCAGIQGQYWPMHDALFRNASKLEAGLYQQLAGQFGLNLKGFDDCMADKSMQQKVQDSLVQGERYGVSGTPKFFVGRIKGGQLVEVTSISGAQGFQAFQSRLDKLLDK